MAGRPSAFTKTAGNQAKGLYGKRDFIYKADDDELARSDLQYEAGIADHGCRATHGGDAGLKAPLSQMNQRCGRVDVSISGGFFEWRVKAGKTELSTGGFQKSVCCTSRREMGYACLGNGFSHSLLRKPPLSVRYAERRKATQRGHRSIETDLFSSSAK
jgi:hypothetical protein